MRTPDGGPGRDSADERSGPTDTPRVGAPRVDRETAAAGARSEGRFVATVPSGLVLLAGVWLVIAPFALGYADAGRPAFWNDVVTGALIALLALPRAVLPRSVPWLSVVNAALGAWLIAAPFALGYRESTPSAVGNDVIMGILVVVAAGTSALLTFALRSRSRVDAGAR